MFKIRGFSLEIFIFFLLLWWVSPSTLAQSTFKAGIFFGGNLSQINNDSYAGYHKVGLNGGIKVLTRLSSNVDLHTELAYSQRGSYTSRFLTQNGYERRSIGLDYIEIPILLSFKDWFHENKKGDRYFVTHAMAGISYGRLINKSSSGFKPSKLTGLPLEDYFKNNDVSLVAGVTFFLTRSIGIHGRFSYSINKLTDNISEEFKDVLGELNTYFVTFRATYLIH